MEIAVLGAGACGTALTQLRGSKGRRLTLWVRSEEAARQITQTRESSYLPGVKLGDAVSATSDLRAAVAGKPIVLSVTPSHGARQVLGEAGKHMGPETIV